MSMEAVRRKPAPNNDPTPEQLKAESNHSTPVGKPFGAKAYVIAALVLLALLAIGIVPKLRREYALSNMVAAQQGPRAVNVAKVQRATEVSELILPASALPAESAAVYARVQGFVRELRVDLGDKVTAGQVLAVLDSPEIEADIRRAEGRVSEAKRNQALADTTTERFSRLAEAGASSKQLADEASAKKNSADALLTASQSDLDRLRSQFGFRLVTAPFAGVITKRNVDKGALVTPGSSAGITSLFEVSRIDTLRIFADVPQNFATAIKVGDEVTLISGATRVPAKVVRTSSALDPNTRTMRVEVHVPGDKGILSGSFVRAAFMAKDALPPVVVPANALVATGKGLVVYTVTYDEVTEVPVQLGRELGATAEVISGLSGGETVVVNVPENLATGTKIRVALPAPTSSPTETGKPK